MKKLMICALMGLFVFASCEDDDNNESSVPTPDVVEGEGEGEGEVEEVEETEDARATVVINELSYASEFDWVELYNPTEETIDVSSYWVCLGPMQYAEIAGLTIVDGSTMLEAGAFVTLNLTDGDSALPLPDDNASFGLYNTNASFTDAENIVDFVQYGVGGSQREEVAVAAGLWTAGDFLPTVASADNTIAYLGTGLGVESWAETTTPTENAENEITTP